MSIKTVRYSPGKPPRTVAIMPTSKPPALVRSTPKKYQPKYKLSNQMRSQVKKICNGMEEVNVKQNLAFGTGSGTGYTNHDFPGRPVTSTHLMKIIPTVAQGTERDEREGAKIRITSLTGQFFCHIPAAYVPATGAEQSASAGQTCRLLVLSCKQLQTLEQVQANWNTGQFLGRQFLKNGSTPESFQGDLWSIRWPVNTELFTKHYDKMFTLKRGIYRGDSNSGAAVTPEVSFAKAFRIKCKNKHLLYNDPANVEHTNWSLFAILLYANNDSSLTTGAAGPIKGNMFAKMTWKEN